MTLLQRHLELQKHLCLNISKEPLKSVHEYDKLLDNVSKSLDIIDKIKGESSLNEPIDFNEYDKNKETELKQDDNGFEDIHYDFIQTRRNEILQEIKDNLSKGHNIECILANWYTDTVGGHTEVDFGDTWVIDYTDGYAYQTGESSEPDNLFTIADAQRLGIEYDLTEDDIETYLQDKGYPDAEYTLGGHTLNTGHYNKNNDKSRDE